MLRKTRIAIAFVMLSLITFYFIDFAGLLPHKTQLLTTIQLVPALLALNIGVLIVLLLLTLLFGRVYCSVICPLGIWQDVTERIAKLFNKKKKYKFLPAKNILRYGLLAIVTIVFLSGFTFLLSLLEPYSIFGRVASNVFRPVYMYGNNLLADILGRFNNYSLYVMEITIQSIFSFVVASLSILIISFLGYKYGRLYCNTICPVGSLLGLISKFSLFKIQINENTCNSCGICASKCKASCIDSKEHKVDHSRCISCFNCLPVCKKKAIKFTYAFSSAKKENETNTSRRTFLAITGVGLAALPLAKAQNAMAMLSNKKPFKKKHPLSPPGSISAKHMQDHCTACHLCVSRCPSHILKPAFTEYGLGGIMQPMMSFEKGFCNYDCTVCSHTCPNGAILPLTKEEKHVTQMGQVVYTMANCIVYTDNTDCGACSEHCPTQAVTMKPYKDGLTIPSVNPEICVGCGGCEYVCPAQPKAINIEGNVVQLKAKHFKEEKKKDVKIDSFGF
ncbi:4Fe-4S dicluster domain-containing protein [uncultured Bacteroides sp.]|uniref:4Fe-4S dicluster domain-containing protein n=1 Tax=uncultured Bacteroides sp. TaxID=162156 RepID=UPI002AAC2928|nr:4Fe-4S dicluster domain-containing protein [uncultured Bacteroides sp.]